MSNEYPILFSSEMIRAILADRKTMTRRIVKPPEHYQHPSWCPYGKIGGKLWCKETYRIPNKDFDRKQAVMVHYYSDRTYKSIILTDTEWNKWIKRKQPFEKTSSYFMYKSIARIWLEITGIKVERLQDISTSDVYAEGFTQDVYSKPESEGWDAHGECESAFQELWDKLNAKRGFGWENNPWVWVISFRRILPTGRKTSDCRRNYDL